MKFIDEMIDFMKSKKKKNLENLMKLLKGEQCE